MRIWTFSHEFVKRIKAYVLISPFPLPEELRTIVAALPDGDLEIEVRTAQKKGKAVGKRLPLAAMESGASS